MKTKLTFILGLLTSACCLPAHAQGTTFTYQGRLTENGVAANGANDLTFTLYDAGNGGTPVGASNVVNDLAVTNGLFTVTLDFGAAFDGSARWLEIAVHGPGEPIYTTLAPRQALTPTPYAIRAANFSGTVASTNLTGKISDTNLSANVALLTNHAVFTRSVTAGVKIALP